MIFEDLKRCSEIAATVAEFKTPATAFGPIGFEDYSTFRSLLESCLKYVWTQWLLGGSKDVMHKNVLFAVNRGLDAHRLVQGEDMRGLHDLLLAACALFVCTSSALREIAENLTEATGEEPNDGELHYRAWSGALKRLVMRDTCAAKAQFKQLEGSYCPAFARTGSRTFLLKAINGQWEDFAILQRKDFERLWKRSRNDGTFRGDVVRLLGWPPQQLWCWTHVALALFGHRQGAKIESDPLWLPPHALHCVDPDAL